MAIIRGLLFFLSVFFETPSLPPSSFLEQWELKREIIRIKLIVCQLCFFDVRIQFCLSVHLSQLMKWKLGAVRSPDYKYD